MAGRAWNLPAEPPGRSPGDAAAEQERAATGRPPLALLQSTRVSCVRALPEGSGLSVDEGATRVGYGGSTALRRLLKRQLGATPRQQRWDAG